MSVKRLLLLVISLCSLVLAVAFSAVVHAESISPAQEQEYADAKAAVENARQVQAEKLAPEPLKQAQDLLKTAASARQSQDVTIFSRASRLARTYAELAKALSEFNATSEKLAATQEEVAKIKLEIEGLKKTP